MYSMQVGIVFSKLICSVTSIRYVCLDSNEGMDMVVKVAMERHKYKVGQDSGQQ